MDFKKTDIVVTETTEQNETPDEYSRRLSARRLSEYEVTCTDTEGRANQLRKERDVERTRNEKLRKDVDKLSNQLLCERLKVTCLKKEVTTLTKKNEDQAEDGDILEKTVISDHHDSTPRPSDQGAGEPAGFPTDPDRHNSLALKLRELKTAIEERMERQGKSKDKQNDQEKFIALSILTQSLQNYLQADHENKHLHKQEPADFVDSGHTHYNSQVNKRPKAQISALLKIMVYICPILFSVLCYIAFTTVKN